MLASPGIPLSDLVCVILQNPAQQVDFAFLQANFMFDLALPDHRLVDAADIGGRSHSRNVHRDFQRDFPIWRAPWA